LSRYSNIESVGLRKCPYYRYHTMNVIDNIHFAELAPHHGGKRRHRYGMKKLRHCRPMYCTLTICSSLTLSLQPENLALLQIFPIIDSLSTSELNSVDFLTGPFLQHLGFSGFFSFFHYSVYFLVPTVRAATRQLLGARWPAFCHA